ncbi:MAG: penicillin-binding protein 1A [Thermodesulfobacteriota bacterium]
MGKARQQARKKRVSVLWFLIPAAFMGTAAGIYFSLAHDLPQIRALEDFNPSGVTRVYAADNTLLAELYIEKRDPIPYEQIPPMLIAALLATEDHRFFSHSGIDLKGIFRAGIRDLRVGEFVEGGSTITQQLAKTLFLTHKKDIQRKIKEVILAFQLERRYTKEQILELYLNQVYLGSGAYGVKAAAEKFFNKPPDQLTVAECALIAGMPKMPSRYSPLANKDLAIARRNTVLRQMLRYNIISRQEYESYSREPLVTQASSRSTTGAPYFIEHIKSFLEDIVGAGPLYRGRLSVYTTLSGSLQQAAENAVSQGLATLGERMSKKQLPGTPQGALVALDVKTGGVLAMVGGKNFQESPFNRATMARRQPGSSFKPILYAYAVGHGFTPLTPILNTPAVFPGATKDLFWKPENFSKKYSGEVTLREALVHSQNIPAARVMNRLGPAPVVDFAAKMGISSPLAPYLSLALGASEITLLEMTSAYAVFPRMGSLIKPYGVNRIVDSKGRLLWQAKPVSERVMPAEDAAIMTDMLQAVIQEGTGRSARDIPCPLAGKTGTTDSCKDALFIGYSKNIATGVWTGTDNYLTLGRDETGAMAALPIWKSFMTEAVALTGCEVFETPEGLTRVWFDPDTGERLPVGAGVSALIKKEPPADNIE